MLDEAMAMAQPGHSHKPLTSSSAYVRLGSGWPLLKVGEGTPSLTALAGAPSSCETARCCSYSIRCWASMEAMQSLLLQAPNPMKMQVAVRPAPARGCAARRGQSQHAWHQRPC